MAIVLFSPEQLAADVAKVLPLIPPDHKRGAIIGTVDQAGAQVVVVLRPNAEGHLEAALVGRHEWTGDNKVGASLVASW